MIRKYYITILVLFIFISPVFVFAQGMMTGNGTVEDDGHTAREEAEGKEIWQKLQADNLKCSELSDSDFGSLGEYFMGQMAGDSHVAMNNMIIQMIGEEGEEQMHVVMGKRLSNCDPYSPIPESAYSSGIFPMMGGMMGGGGMMSGGWSTGFNNLNNNPTSMMNYGYSNFGGFGWIFMIIFWVIVIIGVIAMYKWLSGQNKSDSRIDKSALDILKERYAKGDINKKEYDEKKKDLL